MYTSEYDISSPVNTSGIHLIHMNIYFSGIGGVGIGPLAMIAHDAGHRVQGSDPSESDMVRRLSERGIPINKKQQGAFLQVCNNMHPIDWFVYSSALPDDHPELVMARMLGLRMSKRDEFIVDFLEKTGLKLIAVAGTHGKTSTTSMLVWAFKQLDIPVSYSIGSTLSFGESGYYSPESEYFVYECDEYDRNFLHFHPYLSIITSIDYDHPDTYATAEEYIRAFEQFISQSTSTIMWRHDGAVITGDDNWLLRDDEVLPLSLPGAHNRQNGTLVAKALERLEVPGDHTKAIESFPGVDRRFEKLLPGLYTDYGHHPTEIAATLQLARELSDHVVLVYQPHQNVRQHEVRTLYTDCFEDAETVYWLPTYLSREDPHLEILTADQLTENVTNIDSIYSTDLDDELWEIVQKARDDDKLILFMGAGSIDAWVRAHAAAAHDIDILIMNSEGDILLQKDPQTEQLAAFHGTSLADDDSLAAGAARIVRTETDLTSTAHDMTLFKLYARGTAEELHYLVCYTFPSMKASIKSTTPTQAVNANTLHDFSLSLQARTEIVEYTQPIL